MANHFQKYDDESLIYKFYQTNDNYWLGILLQRYTVLLLGVCMKYLHNEEEAKDAVQQVFYKVIDQLPKSRVQSFRAWIYTITKNYCLMELRTGKNLILEEWKDDLFDLMNEDAPINPLQKEQLYNNMQRALSQLSEEQKICITLFYLNKRSYFEIAEITGYSDVQVKSYIQNGKRNLKNSIEKMQRQNG